MDEASEELVREVSEFLHGMGDLVSRGRTWQ